MLLYNAIRLGESIERYNKEFNEEMHLDFNEIIEMMYDMNDIQEVEDIIQEIEKRIRMKKNAFELYLYDYLDYREYNKIVSGL